MSKYSDAMKWLKAQQQIGFTAFEYLGNLFRIRGDADILKFLITEAAQDISKQVSSNKISLQTPKDVTVLVKLVNHFFEKEKIQGYSKTRNYLEILYPFAIILGHCACSQPTTITSFFDLSDLPVSLEISNVEYANKFVDALKNLTRAQFNSLYENESVKILFNKILPSVFKDTKSVRNKVNTIYNSLISYSVANDSEEKLPMQVSDDNRLIPKPISENVPKFYIRNPSDIKKLQVYSKKQGNTFVYDDLKTIPIPSIFIAPVAALDGHLGVYADEDMKVNKKTVGVYFGKIMRDEEASLVSAYVFETRDGTVIDGEKLRNWAGFMNNSETPNIGIFSQPNQTFSVTFKVNKKIDRFHQLMINYGDSFSKTKAVPFSARYLHVTDNWETAETIYAKYNTEYNSEITKLPADMVRMFGYKKSLPNFILPKICHDLLNDILPVDCQMPDLLIYTVEKQVNEYRICPPSQQEHVTALMLASYLGEPTAIEYLLMKNADANRRTLLTGHNALFFLLRGKANENNKKKGFDLLANRCELGLKDKNGFTLLHYAIEHAQPYILEKLLESPQVRDDLLNHMLNNKDHLGIDDCLIINELFCKIFIKKTTKKWLINSIKSRAIFCKEVLSTTPSFMLKLVAGLLVEKGVELEILPELLKKAWQPPINNLPDSAVTESQSSPTDKEKFIKKLSEVEGSYKHYERFITDIEKEINGLRNQNLETVARVREFLACLRKDILRDLRIAETRNILNPAKSLQIFACNYYAGLLDVNCEIENLGFPLASILLLTNFGTNALRLGVVANDIDLIKLVINIAKENFVRPAYYAFIKKIKLKESNNNQKNTEIEKLLRAELDNESSTTLKKPKHSDPVETKQTPTNSENAMSDDDVHSNNNTNSSNHNVSNYNNVSELTSKFPKNLKKRKHSELVETKQTSTGSEDAMSDEDVYLNNNSNSSNHNGYNKDSEQAAKYYKPSSPSMINNGLFSHNKTIGDNLYDKGLNLLGAVEFKDSNYKKVDKDYRNAFKQLISAANLYKTAGLEKDYKETHATLLTEYQRYAELIFDNADFLMQQTNISESDKFAASAYYQLAADFYAASISSHAEVQIPAPAKLYLLQVQSYLKMEKCGKVNSCDIYDLIKTCIESLPDSCGTNSNVEFTYRKQLQKHLATALDKLSSFYMSP